MGIFLPLLIYILTYNVAAAIVGLRGQPGNACFTFHKRARKARKAKPSTLAPKERARLAELEREVASEEGLEAVSALEDMHFDRDIGASYKRVKVHQPVKYGSQNMKPPKSQILREIEHSMSDNALESLRFPSDADIDQESKTVFDLSLEAAEKWEANKDRFRNPACELVDDITDEEMINKARMAEMEEKSDGPTMKQLFASLEAEKQPTKQENDWKGLVQQFQIEAESSQCYGCGIRLQCNDEKQRGYVDGAVLSALRQCDTHPRCKRCSSMQSGLIFQQEGVALGESAIAAARETVSIVKNALSLNETRNVTLVYMMDAIDMHFEDKLAELIIARRKKRKAETHLYVILNKVDLLPPHSRKRVLMYLHRFINSRAPGLNLKPRHIFLMSSLKGGGVNLFLSVLLEMAYKLHSKVFFVGATNAGKSTFLNRLSRFVTSDNKKKQRLLSTSVVPGTTLTPLRIEAGPRFNLYDTPGIVVTDSLLSHLTANELKMAVPASVSRSKPLRLGAGQSLLLGPFVRIDVLKGRPFFFTPHVSKRITIVQKKTENLASFLSGNPFCDVRMFYGKDLAPSGNPHDRSNTSLPTVKSTQHHVNILGEGWEKATAELCIKGLGFVTIAGALELQIRIETMRGVSVYMREPLMLFDGIPFLRKKLPRKQKVKPNRTL